jgi:hypothetical protein
MEDLKTDSLTLKNFGFLMAGVIAVISLIIFFRQHQVNFLVLALAGLFWGSALCCPGVLKLAYIIWMGLAQVLGWFNTRVILVILFYLVFTPIGLVLRLGGKDILERQIDPEAKTYWKVKPIKVFSQGDYQRLF